MGKQVKTMGVTGKAMGFLGNTAPSGCLIARGFLVPLQHSFHHHLAKSPKSEWSPAPLPCRGIFLFGEIRTTEIGQGEDWEIVGVQPVENKTTIIENWTGILFFIFHSAKVRTTCPIQETVHISTNAVENDRFVVLMLRDRLLFYPYGFRYCLSWGTSHDLPVHDITIKSLI